MSEVGSSDLDFASISNKRLLLDRQWPVLVHRPFMSPRPREFASSQWRKRNGKTTQLLHAMQDPSSQLEVCEIRGRFIHGREKYFRFSRSPITKQST